MITVELRRVPEGGHDYVTVATLSVDDAGIVTTRDPDEYLPVGLPVLVMGPEGFRKVSLEEDPVTWARQLHTVLRTGYLVPVITTDTAPTR